MAGEAKTTATTQVTFATAASVGSGAYSVALGTLGSAETGGYQMADFTITVIFGGNTAAGAVVELYRRPLNIMSTTDGPVPSASSPFTYSGTFPITTGVTASATYFCPDVPIGRGDSEWYVRNGTTQTMSAGWSMYATPWTLIPGT